MLDASEWPPFSAAGVHPIPITVNTFNILIHEFTTRGTLNNSLVLYLKMRPIKVARGGKKHFWRSRFSLFLKLFYSTKCVPTGLFQEREWRDPLLKLWCTLHISSPVDCAFQRCHYRSLSPRVIRREKNVHARRPAGFHFATNFYFSRPSPNIRQWWPPEKRYPFPLLFQFSNGRHKRYPLPHSSMAAGKRSPPL